MIIYRYLSSQLLSSTLAVAFVLSIIIFSGRFLGYMAEAASGKIEGWAVFLVLLYRLPEFMTLILPLSLFLGILLSYGRMYIDYEMIVLKACGVSQWRLVAYSLIPAICMALLVSYLSLSLTPKGFQNYNKILVQQYTRSALELLTPGHFFTTDEGDVLYAERVNSDEARLEGFFSSVRNEDSFVTIVAKSGRRNLDKKTGAQYMELSDGYRYELKKGSKAISETAFQRYQYKLKEPDDTLDSNILQSTPTNQLLSAGTSEELAELQWRFALGPLSIIVVLLAIPLSKVNPRQGRFLKLIPAILIYLSYVGLVLVLKNKIAEGSVPPYPGIWLAHVLFLILAIILLQWEYISGLLHARKQDGVAS